MAGSREGAEFRHQAARRLRNKNAAPVEGMAEVNVRALLHELQVHQIELEMQNEELLRAQTALQEVSDKYHDLFDFAPVGYFHLDEQGRILEVNLAGAALLGLDRSTAVTRRFAQHLAPQSCARFAEFLRDVLQVGRKQTRELKLHRDGKTLYAIVEGVLVPGGGAKRSLRVMVTDISNRKLVEQERERLLRAIDLEKSRLAEFFERSPAFMCVLRGPLLVFERANEEYFQLVGRRNILGKPLREALPEVEGQGYFEILDRVCATGEPFVGKEMAVLLRRTAAGPLEERYVDFIYQPSREADGSISGVFVHGVDVTEQVQAQEDNRTSDGRPGRNGRAVSPPCGTLARCDLHSPQQSDRVRQLGSPALVRRSTADQIIGRSPFDIFHPDCHALVEERIRQLSEGQMVSLSHEKIVRLDGTVRDVEVAAAPFEDQEGRAIQAIARDITERKRAEDLVRAANALLSLLPEKSSRKDYMEAVVELLRNWTGCRCAGIRGVDEQGRIPYEAYAGFSQEFWSQENLLMLHRDQCACTRVILGEPLPRTLRP